MRYGTSHIALSFARACGPVSWEGICNEVKMQALDVQMLGMDDVRVRGHVAAILQALEEVGLVDAFVDYDASGADHWSYDLTEAGRDFLVRMGW